MKTNPTLNSLRRLSRKAKIVNENYKVISTGFRNTFYIIDKTSEEKISFMANPAELSIWLDDQEENKGK